VCGDIISGFFKEAMHYILNQCFIDWCFDGHSYWQQKYLRHHGVEAFGVRVRIWLGISPVQQKYFAKRLSNTIQNDK
jgi:hypothetical protein